MPRKIKRQQKKTDEDIAIARMEKLAAKQPGVMDVLKAYGGYEEALRQVDNYLMVVSPVPQFTTTSTTLQLQD